jgi:hypothetical protein
MKKEKFAGSLPCWGENFQNIKVFNFWISKVFAHSESKPLFVLSFIFSHIINELQQLPHYNKKVAKPKTGKLSILIIVIAFYKLAVNFVFS